MAEFFGAIFAIGPLFYTLCLIIAKGWKKVTTIRDRPLPPDTFEDKRWGEHKFIRIPNLRMHYVEKGDHDKPLMVFLHGFPEFWFSWRYQLEHFSTSYWCVAPDLRGYGDTDKPSGIDQYTTDKLADDIKNLVKGSKKNIVLTYSLTKLIFKKTTCKCFLQLSAVTSVSCGAMTGVALLGMLLPYATLTLSAPTSPATLPTLGPLKRPGSSLGSSNSCPGTWSTSSARSSQRLS